jgi:hypothetical protein
VIGEASADEDFIAARDRVRYSIALGVSPGPFQIDAELWFQPVSFRWAANLRTYDASEPRRFTEYYNSMASDSAVVLARSSARGIE